MEGFQSSSLPACWGGIIEIWPIEIQHRYALALSNVNQILVILTPIAAEVTRANTNIESMFRNGLIELTDGVYEV